MLLLLWNAMLALKRMRCDMWHWCKRSLRHRWKKLIAVLASINRWKKIIGVLEYQTHPPADNNDKILGKTLETRLFKGNQNQKLEGVWTLEEGDPIQIDKTHSLCISLFWFLKILAALVSNLSPQSSETVGLFLHLPSLCQNLGIISSQRSGPW